MDDRTTVERGFRITGRVQGVGFRWWTTRLARELDVEGAVANRPDGSVEIRARGPADAVATFRSRLEEGPSTARVERVDEVESTLKIRDGDFRVARWGIFG